MDPVTGRVVKEDTSFDELERTSMIPKRRKLEIVGDEVEHQEEK
jgi:hypothetical protein